MGVAYPSAIFAAPDGSGYTYSITAKITWDSSYYVTVESVWSDELSSDQFSWRIKGRASQGDNNTYAEKYSNNGFQGTANKEYILQGCCVPGGVYDNSGINYLFKLSPDSSDSGGSGSGGSSSGGTPYGKIYISKGIGVKTIDVERRPIDTTDYIKIYNGDTIYKGDYFRVYFEPEPGYELDFYPMDDGFDGTIDTPINSTNLVLISYRGGSNLDAYIKFPFDVTIQATASLKEEEYTLSFNNDDNSYATVRRINSKNENAYLGILDNGATIYSADVLDIIVGASTGYMIENVNVSGCVANDNGTYTVIGDTNISISTSRQ
jgi:hypothetical protein